MRRLLALTLLIPTLVLSFGAVAAGLAAPAALAAGDTATSASGSSPSLNLSNAEQNASSGNTTSGSSSAATTTSSSGGISGTDAILIAVVAVALLSGIAFWVWHDSRRHTAQVGHNHEDPMYGARSHPGSKTPYKPRKLKPAERKRRKRGRAR